MRVCAESDNVNLELLHTIAVVSTDIIVIVSFFKHSYD